MARRKLKVARAASEQHLLTLLRSIDSRDRKDALQIICEALEAGYRIVPDQNVEFATAIAAQRNSTDATVRRWFYKYVGLSQQSAYVPILIGRVGQEDDQTAAWVIGALGAILGVTVARDHLKKAGVPEDLLRHTDVFTSYFLPETVDRSVVRKVVLGDESLLERWVSFLNTRAAHPELAEYTRHLNTDADPEIAEYSIWSAGRVGGFAATSVQPDRIPELPSQVRRWAYHTVASDAEARVAYADLLWLARDNESDERVREGIITGLAKAQLDRGWMDFIRDWETSDSNPRIKALIQRTVADTEAEHRGNILLPPRRAKRNIQRKGQTQMFGVPKVENTARQMAYVLALDTVSFSESSDDNQLRVVNAFLDYLANHHGLLTIAPSDLVPLFTGDGIIIGILGADNARVPLETAIALQADFSELYKFQMRAGLHCGSVHKLSMSDGSTQLIGHALNEAARVMAGAPAGGIVISDAYYAEALHRGRERLEGYNLEPREITDKHGHRLSCFDVRRIGA